MSEYIKDKMWDMVRKFDWFAVFIFALMSVFVLYASGCVAFWVHMSKL